MQYEEGLIMNIYDFVVKKMVRKSTISAPVAMALLFRNITRLTLMVTTPYHCING